VILLQAINTASVDLLQKTLAQGADPCIFASRQGGPFARLFCWHNANFCFGFKSACVEASSKKHVLYVHLFFSVSNAARFFAKAKLSLRQW
jgi:hypothetical protein